VNDERPHRHDPANRHHAISGWARFRKDMNLIVCQHTACLSAWENPKRTILRRGIVQMQTQR